MSCKTSSWSNWTKKKGNYREIEEMPGLRRSSSEDVSSEAEWNEFIKNYKTQQFEICELASTLRRLIKQFRIEGTEGFGWREFMEKAKPEVLRITRENCEMKVKLILLWEMVRDNEDGLVQLQDAFFHTKVIESLRETDESEVFDVFMQTFDKRIQNFDQRGGNWKFQRVISWYPSCRMPKWQTVSISQGSIMKLPPSYATYTSEHQSLLQWYSTIQQTMIPI